MLKLTPKKDFATQWQTQDRKQKTYQKVKAEFCQPEFSATKIMTWECHVDAPNESRYDMILGRGLLMSMILDLKLSIHIIVRGKTPYEGCMTPMMDMITYDYGSLNSKTHLK